MKLHFYGVRASLSSPRPETSGIGGNTPCIALHDEADRLLILEAGNGLYRLGRELLESSPLGAGHGHGALLLSGTTWDRIQGFPFFAPVFIPGNEISIYSACDSERALELILEGQMQPEYSPLASLDNLGARLTFETVCDAPTVVLGFSVSALTLPHPDKGQSTVYRIEERDRSVAYSVDLDSGTQSLEDAEAFCQGADVLIHAAYHLGAKPPGARNHQASLLDALALARAANIPRLVTTYYHPDHDDAMIEEAIAAASSSAIDITIGREGLTLDL